MEKYYWLNDLSRAFLNKWYLVNWQSAEERIKEISKCAEKRLGVVGFWAKFEEYMSLGYYSLSTPVRCNYGNNRWLPISCFWSCIEDDMSSILFTQAEVWMMSKFWWGTSWYFWKLRHRWAPIKNNWESSWAVHFMQLFESLTDVVSQWSSRRWHFSPYLDVEHNDIEEFLKIWTEWNPIQKLTHWVCISSKWMTEMIEWDEWKRDIWAMILKRRSEVWYPYIFFTDNANENKPDCYKNCTINHSNMCTEIMLPNNEDESFVCCLASINMLHWDRIKDTDAIETMIMFLDTVITEFCEKIDEMPWNQKYFMSRARKFAERHRALWLWVIWWHSYLQSNMIAFESEKSLAITWEIFRTIKLRAEKASNELAKMFWPCEMCDDRRNTTLLSIAPTTSSAFILWQVSQSIEPYMSNYFIKDTAKVKTVFKNPYLENLLKNKWMDNESVWDSIRENDGSVQHIDWLSKEERDVFKTYSEINQDAIIEQAALRQKYIDQWQSLNLLLPSTISVKEINRLHIKAWNMWIKSLYYQHSFNKAQQVARKIKCVWCEA